MLRRTSTILELCLRGFARSKLWYLPYERCHPFSLSPSPCLSMCITYYLLVSFSTEDFHSVIITWLQWRVTRRCCYLWSQLCPFPFLYKPSSFSPPGWKVGLLADIGREFSVFWTLNKTSLQIYCLNWGYSVSMNLFTQRSCMLVHLVPLPSVSNEITGTVVLLVSLHFIWSQEFCVILRFRVSWAAIVCI